MNAEKKFNRGISSESKKMSPKGSSKMIPLKQAEIIDFQNRHYSVSPPKLIESSSRGMLLLPGTTEVKKKTLVLDLDETLVRSTLHPQVHNDYVFQVNYILYN